MNGDEYAALQAATEQAADTLTATTASAVNRTPASGDLLDVLGSIRLVEIAAQGYRRALVRQLHGEGYSWQELGDTLALTAQEARARYGQP